MTFALTSFVADGVKFQGPGPYRAIETYALTITAAATDVDLDLGDTTGTFWTAAQADSTYGEMATQVLSWIEQHEGQIQAVKNLFVPELVPLTPVLSLAATGTYTVDLNATTFLPDYTFYTAGGLTAYTVFVDYLLNPNTLPANISYNIG